MVKKITSKSSDRLKLDFKDRDTLLPCPACHEKGYILINSATGGYSSRKCRWCDGLGNTLREAIKLFIRWEKIRKFNKC